MLLGSALAAMGLLVRGWSAGTIRKEEALAISGPYAFTRNPLYLGSLAIGVGLGAAGGHWIWPVLFVVYFAVVYTRTVADEGERLAHLFGHGYVEYVAHVPGFVPRLTPYRADGAGEVPPFQWSQYRRNREWEALLGAAATIAILAIKMR